MEFDRAGFDRDVGVRLQRTRKERGITQQELAKRLGLPRPSYANIESGRQRVPLDVNPAYNSLFIAEPLNPMRAVGNLFQTHPPLEARLMNLIGRESTGRVR